MFVWKCSWGTYSSPSKNFRHSLEAFLLGNKVIEILEYMHRVGVMCVTLHFYLSFIFSSGGLPHK
jgi:hypothetical protein